LARYDEPPRAAIFCGRYETYSPKGRPRLGERRVIDAHSVNFGDLPGFCERPIIYLPMTSIEGLAARLLDTVGLLDAVVRIFDGEMDIQPMTKEVRQAIQGHRRHVEDLTGQIQILATAIARESRGPE
jgi:hypothetical protein